MVFILYLLGCAEIDSKIYEQHFYRCIHEAKVLTDKTHESSIPEEVILQCNKFAKDIASL